MKTIFKLVLLVLIGSSIGSIAVRAINAYKINKIWHSLSLTKNSIEVFLPKMIRGLPLTAKRYLLHSIQRGAALANRVEIKMTGSIRIDEKSDWLPFKATEVIARGRGFLWKAKIKKSRFVYLVGADYYFNREGRVLFSILGVVPEVYDIGPTVDLSSAGRAVIESIWLPTVFLPRHGTRWESIDDLRAKATISVGNFVSAVEMMFGKDGRLKKSMMLRYRKEEGGRVVLVPFGIIVEEEKRFNGFTIPSKVRAGWGCGTDQYMEVFRVTIEEADFY